MFQDCPGIAELAVKYNWQGEDCFNIHHVDNGTGSEWDPADLGTLGNTYADWWAANMQALDPGDKQLVSIIVRDLTTDSSASVEGVYGGVGAADGDSLPNNCTIAVKWVTGLAGRSARGRTYHIGLQEEYVLSNTLDDARAALLITAYTALIAALNGTGLGTMVVLSRFHNKAPRAEGIGIAIGTCTFADLKLDSQRRRLPGK